MVNTPINELRKERSEFEKFKKESLEEIQLAAIKLDTQMKIFDGNRDIKSWEATLQHPIDKENFEMKRDLIDAQISFKNGQIKHGVIEINEGYKDKVRRSFELKADIDMLELQKKVLDVKEMIADKEEEIRQKLRDHDKELMEQHLKGQRDCLPEKKE